MDAKTMSKIVETANYSFQKPRKKHKDRVFIIAGILITSLTVGKEWELEQLKKFGWTEPITPENRASILAEAERLIREG